MLRPNQLVRKCYNEYSDVKIPFVVYLQSRKSANLTKQTMFPTNAKNYDG